MAAARWVMVCGFRWAFPNLDLCVCVVCACVLPVADSNKWGDEEEEGSAVCEPGDPILRVRVPSCFWMGWGRIIQYH